MARRSGGLKRDFSSRPRRRAARPLDLALLALGAAAFVLSVYAVADAWTGQRRVTARAEETRREADDALARVRELEARREPAQGIASQALLTAEAPPPRVLADLVALMPGDVRLDAVTLTYGEPLGLQVDVAARNASSYDLFLDRLQRSPLFADVLPGDENRDGELRTSIRMTYRPRGGPEHPRTAQRASDSLASERHGGERERTRGGAFGTPPPRTDERREGFIPERAR